MLADWEYQRAITVDKQVQPFTDWITCSEADTELINDFPKINTGDFRIEIGNFRFRDKSAPGIIYINGTLLTKNPGAGYYWGTGTDEYIDWVKFPETSSNAAQVKTIKRAFSTQSYTLPSRAFDILSVDWNGSLLLHPETGMGDFTITDDGVNPQTINIGFTLSADSICQVVYWPLAGTTAPDPEPATATPVTGFAGIGQSSTEILLTWTNPA